MSWWQGVKALFQPKAVSDLVAAELKEAERSLLACLSAQEFAAAMVAYERQRVTRLKAEHDRRRGEAAA